jgi:hypothetical protein
VNEETLREALRTTMTVVPEPPPMESAVAVRAGRRAVHRRTAVAGLAGVLVAVTAVGVGVWLPRQGGGTPMTAAAQPSAMPSPGDTKPSWPIDGNGKPQQDATARSGVHYEKGQQVLQGVLAVVPAGYSTPTGNAGEMPLRINEASVESGNSWGYTGSAAVAKGGGTGRLMAEVHTKLKGLPTDPCALTQTFWGMRGQCQVVTVGKVKVGVVVKPGRDTRLDQWAGYRYPDGVVVYVAQSRSATNDDKPPVPALSKLPLTIQQLAALAVDARFHIS